MVEIDQPFEYAFCGYEIFLVLYSLKHLGQNEATAADILPVSNSFFERLDMP